MNKIGLFLPALAVFKQSIKERNLRNYWKIGQW